MSAHVNLLPPELAERSKATRARNLTVIAIIGWVALLVVLYVIKLGTVAAVENERDAAQEDVDRLNAQVAELEPFAELDRQLTARNELLAAAMATEVSWARLLNDLALAFPGNSSLLTFTADTGASEAADQAAQPTVGDGGDVGRVNFTGYSVQEFAPGVEAVLLRLSDVRGLRSAYLSEGAEEVRSNRAVTSFVGRADLTDDIFTGRYVEGLPAERDE